MSNPVQIGVPVRQVVRVISRKRAVHMQTVRAIKDAPPLAPAENETNRAVRPANPNDRG